MNRIIPEKNWKAEMLIRGEGYSKNIQPQRIGVEKIKYSQEAGTSNMDEKIC